MTGMTALGAPVTDIGEDTFVVTYDQPISQKTADLIKRKWAETVGGRLIVLDSGAKLTRLRDVEPTPIYDALAAEHGDPLGGAA